MYGTFRISLRVDRVKTLAILLIVVACIACIVLHITTKKDMELTTLFHGFSSNRFASFAHDLQGFDPTTKGKPDENQRMQLSQDKYDGAALQGQGNPFKKTRSVSYRHSLRRVDVNPPWLHTVISASRPAAARPVISKEERAWKKKQHDLWLAAHDYSHSRAINHVQQGLSYAASHFEEGQFDQPMEGQTKSLAKSVHPNSRRSSLVERSDISTGEEPSELPHAVFNGGQVFDRLGDAERAFSQGKIKMDHHRTQSFVDAIQNIGGRNVLKGQKLAQQQSSPDVDVGTMRGPNSNPAWFSVDRLDRAEYAFAMGKGPFDHHRAATFEKQLRGHSHRPAQKKAVSGQLSSQPSVMSLPAQQPQRLRNFQPAQHPTQHRVSLQSASRPQKLVPESHDYSHSIDLQAVNSGLAQHRAEVAGLHHVERLAMVPVDDEEQVYPSERS